MDESVSSRTRFQSPAQRQHVSAPSPETLSFLGSFGRVLLLRWCQCRGFPYPPRAMARGCFTLPALRRCSRASARSPRRRRRSCRAWILSGSLNSRSCCRFRCFYGTGGADRLLSRRPREKQHAKARRAIHALLDKLFGLCGDPTLQAKRPDIDISVPDARLRSCAPRSLCQSSVLGSEA